MESAPRRFGIVLMVLIYAAGLTACGGGGHSHPAPRAPRPAAATPARAGEASPGPLATPNAGLSIVARSTTDLNVFARPGDPTPTQTLPARTGFGSARALLVIDRRGSWLQVLLPTRPNGSTGWLHLGDVELRQVDVSIEVDLAARTLTVRRGGGLLLTTPVAIGAPSAPTPTGDFYVVDKLATGSAASAYGPFALGLSGHSDVLTEFGGGDGQVGIHGTDDPSSIGRAVSHGCLRVPNAVAVRLNGIVPLGTPVRIR